MSPNIPQLSLHPHLQTLPTNHRNRSSSLSIARSPGILASSSSSSSVATPAPDISNATHALPPMTRVRSNPSYHARAKSTLSDIPDQSPTDSDSDNEEYQPKRSSEAERLLRNGGDEEESTGRADVGVGYRGPFQPPSSGEMLGVMLSFGGVVLLSVAAGLTTIYDWVL